MSIPAGTKPSDEAKYREMYRNSLRMEAANHQRTMDAVRLLGDTGEVIRTRDDPRTTTEKRADMERTKVKVLSDLKEITSGDEAIKIVNGLDRSELIFVNDAMPMLITDVRTRFRDGVPSAIFIPYVKRMMITAQKTLGVRYGLQTGSTDSALLTDKNILTEMASMAALDNMEDAVFRTPESVPRKADALALINLMKNQIPTKGELEKIRQLPNQPQIQHLLSNMLENVPNDAQVNRLTGDLEKALSRSDVPDMGVVISRVIALLDLPLTDIMQRDALVSMVRAELKDGVFGEDEPVAADAKVGRRIMSADDFDEKRPARQREILEVLRGEGQLKMSKTALGRRSSKIMSELYREWYDNQLGSTMVAVAEPAPIIGTGIARPIRPRMAVDMVKKGFKPMGTKWIHAAKLSKNILSVRYGNCANLGGFPSRKISEHFSNVLTGILNGDSPKFADLNAMDKSEQRLLGELARITNMESKLSIPTPDKDADAAEENRFMVLKGQILAGNDSVPLVKEFKKTLMKFMKDKRLPRGESLDILEVLVSMGY